MFVETLIALTVMYCIMRKHSYYSIIVVNIQKFRLEHGSETSRPLLGNYDRLIDQVALRVLVALQSPCS